MRDTMSDDIIVQHMHCPVCGKAIPPEEQTCSEACQERLRQTIKKRKTYTWIMYALMMLIVILFALGGSM